MARGRLERRVVVGIDLGQSCGYCALSFDGAKPARLDSGLWDFSSKHGGGGVQGLRLDRLLTGYILAHKPAVVACEEVTFLQRGTAAARVYWGMWRTVEMVCERLGVTMGGVHVGTVKKLVAGSGHAEKEAVQAAVEKMFRYRVKKLDESDAIGVALAMAARMDWWKS